MAHDCGVQIIVAKDLGHEAGFEMEKLRSRVWRLFSLNLNCLRGRVEGLPQLALKECKGGLILWDVASVSCGNGGFSFTTFWPPAGPNLLK